MARKMSLTVEITGSSTDELLDRLAAVQAHLLDRRPASGIGFYAEHTAGTAMPLHIGGKKVATVQVN